MSGGVSDLRISNDLRRTLDSAEKEMSKLKDEYVSAEHYLLALAGENNSAAKALEGLGASRDKIVQGLQQVRGSQRVTDQNPEGKYQTLEKYGRDLTQLARRGKIDPVIGRDNEIRRVMQSAVAPDEKQSGADRRTWRWQDCHRGRTGAAHRLR